MCLYSSGTPVSSYGAAVCSYSYEAEVCLYSDGAVICYIHMEQCVIFVWSSSV